MKAFICTQHGMAFAGSCLTISEEWDIDHGRGQMPSSTHITNKLKLRFSRFSYSSPQLLNLRVIGAPIFSVEDGHRLKGASVSCFESRMQLTVLLGVLVFCFFVMLLIAASRLLPQNPLKMVCRRTLSSAPCPLLLHIRSPVPSLRFSDTTR